MTSTILRQHATPALLQLRAYELGVEVQESCDDPSYLGMEVRSWINDWRSKGRGSVMPVDYLRRRAAGQWFGVGDKHFQYVAQRVDRKLAGVLNDPRCGVALVELAHRCVKCGAE